MKAAESLLTSFFAWLGVVAMIAIFNLAWALPIKWTWNATMPYLFGLPVITWGKAWCLNFLSTVLIKSIHVKNKY